jgi:4-hydroxyproline epimerase
VFYGEKAIDRSPCGTGTSARLAHLHATGRLRVGDRFVHQSYIESEFVGRVEEEVTIGDRGGIVPSIEGRAFETGHSIIHIDDADPFATGFSVL